MGWIERWWGGRTQRRAYELERLVAERTAALRERERELTDRNALLESQVVQLQELDRARSRFFASVAHEFRTRSR